MDRDPLHVTEEDVPSLVWHEHPQMQIVYPATSGVIIGYLMVALVVGLVAFLAGRITA